MIKNSHNIYFRKPILPASFIREWTWNALGYALMVGLVIGIGAFLLPFTCYVISCCFGVGAEAIGWIMPGALTLTGAAIGAVVGRYIGKRQREILERNLSIKLNWQVATQYGLLLGFAIAGLLLLPLTDIFSPMIDSMTSSILAFAVMFPLINFVVGTAQWLIFRQVVEEAWRWVSVQVLSSLIVSTILLVSTSADIVLRLMSAMLMLICLGLLKVVMDETWYTIPTHLAGIALISSLLFLFADDVLLFVGIRAYAVESAFLLMYLTFLVATLSMFKAHLGASALVDMLQMS